ncbi:M1 family metallopeptidase [Rhodovulum sp. YNF3179]|uniref:M1 family metallopeptidase n=1 Tax=Rhodovulum sp. YNF3179 TaxID=3425127 RepID=UPI003D3460C6
MTALLRPVLVLICLAVPALAETPVLQTVRLSLDPDGATLEVETRIEAPEGPVRLPDLGWLEITGLAIGDRAAVPDGATLAPGRHGGAPVTVRLAGRLPQPARPIGLASMTADGGHLVGADWLPRDDRALRRFRLGLSVPESHRVVATGSLSGETRAEGRYRADFVFTGRPRDLGLFVGRYTIAEEIRDGRRIRTYFEDGDADLSAAYIDAAAGYLARYEAEIGPYPYDSFAVVSAPIPVGLGFAGLTYVARSILSHPYMRGRSLAHEVVHSWWGNAVAVDYAAGNWAEGLTTFQADYALAEAEGAAAAREMRLEWLRGLAQLPADDIGALRDFRSAAHDGRQAVGYGKAALVLHMLRDEIGPAAFRAGIRRFYAAQESEVAGWADLADAFGAAAGRDLSGFFDQWINRPGLPEIRLDAAEAIDTGGGPALRIALSQSGPAFRLAVPLRIDTAAGTVTRHVRLEDTRLSVTLPLDAPATGVHVDPGFDLARRLLPGEVPPTLRALSGAGMTLRLAGTAAGLEEAARTLAARLLRREEVALEAPGAATADLLVIGTTAAVSRLRDEMIAGPAPWDPATGAARIWAERDATGRQIVFASADRVNALTEELVAAPYYAGRSYVAFAAGATVETGVWDMPSSPLARSFATAQPR